ncbi:transmembrane protein 205 [Microcaecilia unicolor]|uniref:Transmembrane protein 205 n=1 Tax=Microcaecilia unicolor TaxID=1415580 RepID=A0A6P7XQX9_9AMPH|nr:transmembrane protein 205 [Microcaecilia unicolor]XP_030052819.1 transmembrane protein 205 [Microcaecilia unicolor]
MPMEGDPTSLVKVVHLLCLSTAWGMQVWVTFIAGFVLIREVSRHTFGLVQSKLFPFYFYAVLGCSFLNLALYAMYHPRELLSSGETLQISLFFICMVLAAVNARWFSPTTTKAMLKMQEIEKEHGLGLEVGLQAQREAYQKLREQDPKYRGLRQKFFRYHGLSSLCNLVSVLATGVNLCCAALHLHAL